MDILSRGTWDDVGTFGSVPANAQRGTNRAAEKPWALVPRAAPVDRTLTCVAACAGNLRCRRRRGSSTRRLDYHAGCAEAWGHGGRSGCTVCGLEARILQTWRHLAVGRRCAREATWARRPSENKRSCAEEEARGREREGSDAWVCTDLRAWERPPPTLGGGGQGSGTHSISSLPPGASAGSSGAPCARFCPPGRTQRGP